MKHILEKFAPVGTFISALGCPVCFPALSAVGSALGIGVFASYEKEFLVVMQIFMFLTMILFYVSYRRTRYLPSFLVGIFAGGVMFFSWYVSYIALLFYAGMVSVIFVSFWNFWLERKLPSCKDGSCSAVKKTTPKSKTLSSK